MQNESKTQYERVGEHVAIFRRGGTWHAYYRLDGRPVRQSLKTISKKEARRKALAIERDLVNGELHRPVRAPLIENVVEEYISHLRASGRSEKTIAKYMFTFRLVLELAEKRGITRVDQLDLAFINAFRLERNTHRENPKG